MFMVADVISINHDNTEAHASNMQNVSDDCNKSNISGMDDKTTITANKKLNNSYDTAQNLMDQFGRTLSQDGENIKKISNAFKNVDAICANKVSRLCS